MIIGLFVTYSNIKQYSLHTVASNRQKQVLRFCRNFVLCLEWVSTCTVKQEISVLFCRFRHNCVFKDAGKIPVKAKRSQSYL